MRLNNDRGFTLVELMIVAAAAAVIIGVAVPQIQGSLRATRLESSANLIAYEIKMARTLAMTRNAVYEVTFDVQNRTIQVTDPADPENPPRTPKRLEPGIRFGYGPVTPIRFYPRGRADIASFQLVNDSGDVIYFFIEGSGKVHIGDYYAGVYQGDYY